MYKISKPGNCRCIVCKNKIPTYFDYPGKGDPYNIPEEAVVFTDTGNFGSSIRATGERLEIIVCDQCLKQEVNGDCIQKYENDDGITSFKSLNEYSELRDIQSSIAKIAQQVEEMKKPRESVTNSFCAAPEFLKHLRIIYNNIYTFFSAKHK